jgi:hypothetical protein
LGDLRKDKRKMTEGTRGWQIEDKSDASRNVNVNERKETQ